MTFNSILKIIFKRQELKDNPPILIDIGASEVLHQQWKKIAKYSWCIAFDADERDFQFIEDKKSDFKKLFIYNCIVSDSNSDETDFYLTESPYCSSLLKPDEKKLKSYLHSPLFKIKDTVKLKSKTLTSVLSELNISRIDWFKSDSQGIDLRLFKSIDETIQEKVIVAELEPGIINAYLGEDKLFQILEYFHTQNFWLSNIEIKGVPRISDELFSKIFENRLTYKIAKESVKKSPGWGEMVFFNDITNNKYFTIRDYLLAWIFATIEEQHPYALNLANEGLYKFQDKIFSELIHYSIKQMKMSIIKLKFLPSVKEYLNKYFKRYK